MKGTDQKILEVEHLSVTLDGKQILRDISFSLNQGEPLAIVGPNGAGKTVLFRALLGSVSYTGDIRWHDGIRIGYVPQRFAVDKNIPLTVREFFLLKAPRFWFPPRAFMRHVSHELSAGGLTRTILGQQLSELSGGELQRVLISWAMVGHPGVLLFDDRCSSRPVDLRLDEDERTMIAWSIPGAGRSVPMEHDEQHLFDSIYSHGFARFAVAMPSVDIAGPEFNTDQTLLLARQAVSNGAVLVIFPELGLSAYSNEDLFLQDALLDAVETGLARVLDASRELPLILVIGAPLRSESRLFNCAIVIYRGSILGVIPKTYLPNYREFYEKRQFTSGDKAVERSICLFGNTIPFGNDIILRAANLPDFTLHIEICEDVWVPLPPSTLAAMAGATILANLSASNSIVAKAEYRRLLCSSQSAKCIAAYLYTAAGPGESTTDLAWDGHSMIYENGERLAESARFAGEPSLTMADVDLDRLRQERMRMTSFSDCVAAHRDQLEKIRVIPFHLEIPKQNVPLRRDVQRFPYVPADPHLRDERCNEVYNIQVQGLTKRLEATALKRVVIGISGGLDSTQAALVVSRAFDRLGLPRENVLGVTMPGFATSAATLANARDLTRYLGFSAKEIDIRAASQQMFSDIDHPFSRGEPVYDVTFENVQAGERTSHLFRLANFVGGLVVGTGDLSEFALGFTTYGVGDQMSHYNVNASVPKTLIQFLIRWLINTRQFDNDTLAVLTRIVGLKCSPELVPGPGLGESQTAEAVIGPYELHDFFLYYLSRFGLRPSKVALLAQHAWGDINRGSWPEIIPPESRNTYDLRTICRWLEVFLFRFFQLSQFKRSAMPNAPKVGSGGSLSPRSDWRAPSDAHADVWIQELRNRVGY